AFGRPGNEATSPFSHSAKGAQSSAGPRVQSMKKQGPAPCGIKTVGKVMAVSALLLRDLGGLLNRRSGRMPLDEGRERLGEALQELGHRGIAKLAASVEQGARAPDV